MPGLALRSVAVFALTISLSRPYSSGGEDSEVGRKVAISHHLRDGKEFDLSIPELISYGKKLFEARFTSQEGAGRPTSKGTGVSLSDPSRSLVFPRNNNRLSGPES